MAYSAAIGGNFGGGGGAPASTGGNVTTENRNKVADTAKTSPKVLHLAIGVVVVGILILGAGRGWLRNARVA